MPFASSWAGEALSSGDVQCLPLKLAQVGMGERMRMILLAAGTAATLGGCALKAPAPEAEQLAVQETLEPPVIPRQNPGDDVYVYHNLKGDCAWLTHGYGRNNAWGLWRLPLTQVTTGVISGDEANGFELTYACKDGSACIEAGDLEETPDRVGDHTIPFQTQARAEDWLAQVGRLTAACTAAH
jgi:hypothetical protein